MYQCKWRPQLQELGLEFQLGDAYLQTKESDYHLLFKACSQWSSFPMARPLYLLYKKMLSVDEYSCYNDHLAVLYVMVAYFDQLNQN